MWSGPRNISTAMMRAWGNRTDTVVVDEPFYAYYLQKTGADHPGASEVIAQGETDWRKVVEHLTVSVPGEKPVFYQKQMTHHLLPEISRDWLRSVTNCFLIRHPAEVIASYIRKNHDPSVEDLGFVQQREIFDFVCANAGTVPPVLDARDVLENPAGRLGFCATRWACRSATRCCRGQQDCAKPMGFGRNIGIRRWRAQPPSGPTPQGWMRCPSGCDLFTTSAWKCMNNFTSIGCVETGGVRASLCCNNLMRETATC